MTESDNSGNSESNHDGTPVEISRRRLLGTVGAAGATGLVIGAAGGVGISSAVSGEGTTGGSGAGGPQALTSVGATEVMFHGKHQAGITQPLQSRGHLVAFDLAPGAGRKEAMALLRRWSATAKVLMAGKAPAEDTGIALDAGPSS
ncbi:hypothetical protein SNARM312S_06073 [Streptomyces narbonensis]